MIEPSKSSSRTAPSNELSHQSSSLSFPKELFPSTPVAKTLAQSTTSSASVSTPGDSIYWGFPSTPCPTPSSIAESLCMTPLSPPRGMDDLDAMLCHEDFPKLIALTASVMSLQPKKASTASKDDPWVASDVIGAVTRMQEQLLSSQVSEHIKPMIVRGQYTMIDSLLEDSFAILEKEVDRCQRQSDSQQLPSASSSSSTRKTKDGSAIAVKYSKWQTDILMQWMIEHKDNPFPDPTDVDELIERTGLDHSQVINWTTNVRKRNRKATCEDGKKPHHFIDFVFLADHRDSKKNKNKLGLGSVAAAMPKTPSRASPSASSLGYQTPTSQKKRKADAMDTPSPAPTPSPHHRAYYAQFSTPTHGQPYFPEYGYGPPPHAYPYGPHPPSPSYHYAYPPPPPTPVSPVPGASPQHHPGQSFAVGLPPRHPSTPSPGRRSRPVAKARSSVRKVAPVSLPSIPEEVRPTDAPVPMYEVKIKQEQSPSPTKDVAPDPQPSTSMVRIKKEPTSPPTTNTAYPCVNLFHDATALDPINVDDIPDGALLHDFATFWDVYIKEEEEPQPATVMSLYPSDSISNGGQFWLVPSVSADIQEGSDWENDDLDIVTNDLKIVKV